MCCNTQFFFSKYSFFKNQVWLQFTVLASIILKYQLCFKYEEEKIETSRFIQFAPKDLNRINLKKR